MSLGPNQNLSLALEKCVCVGGVGVGMVMPILQTGKLRPCGTPVTDQGHTEASDRLEK